MIGLVKKDLLGISHSMFSLKSVLWNSLFLLSPMFLRLLKGTSSYLLMNGILCAFIAMSPIEFIKSDTLYKTTKRSLTYPVSANKIVASRFISCSLISATFFIVVCLADVLNVLLLKESSIGVFGSLFLLSGVGLLFMCVGILGSYTGSQTIQVVMMFIALALAVTPMLFNIPFEQIFQTFFSFAPIMRLTMLTVCFLAVMAILFLASVKVFSRKIKQSAL